MTSTELNDIEIGLDFLDAWRNGIYNDGTPMVGQALNLRAVKAVELLGDKLSFYTHDEHELCAILQSAQEYEY